MEGLLRKALCALLTGFALWTMPVEAQRPGQPDPGRLLPDLTESEARAALTEFRQQRLQGDYAFRFELDHRPRRGQTQRFSGGMWGTWDDFDPLIRVHLIGVGEAPQPDRFLLRSGEQASFWTTRADSTHDAVEVTGSALHRPLVPGLTYTPFDLVMPFTHWSEATYLGRDRIANRLAYVFYLRPGPGQADTRAEGVDGVRLSIFADHNVLLRAETVDASGNALKSFKVRSFQQVNGQYIVKRIDLVDERARDKTRFEVSAAALGIRLPDTVFEPGSLKLRLNVPGPEAFERL
ncbi:MAG: outer membrane lipoprotein-sorting protein [Opitutales bacterium]